MYALRQCRNCVRDYSTMESYCAFVHEWVDGERCDRIREDVAAKYDEEREEAETEGWTK